MLSSLIVIPILAAIVIGLWPSTDGRQPRLICGLVSALMLAISLWLCIQFDPTVLGPQFVESYAWIEAIGFRYSLGVDGLGLPLVVLNSLLMMMVVYAGDRNMQRPQLYHSMLLVIMAGVNGAFVAQDMLLFFLFYEVELIPLYLLIGIWGGAKRGYAATKFLIYTAISGALLLAAFLGLATLGGGGELRSFAYAPELTQLLPIGQQGVLLALLLVGFGIKIPLVPLHTWLPDAHVEASTPVSMLLAGVLLKLGTYGILHFGLGLLPEAWQAAAPYLAIWAVVSTLYGSLNAIVQTDMKKVVAYSSIGHMGYILLAAAAATPLSLSGAVSQMVAHGLISALLFLEVGYVYNRTGTRDLNQLRGLLTPERGLPIAGTLMIVGAMASSGLPGMAGFIAEFCIFRGSFLAFPVQTLLCMVGTGLTSVYFLLMINKAFFGRLPVKFAQMNRVALREHIPGALLALLIVAFGLWPQGLVRWSNGIALELSQRVAAVQMAPIVASPTIPVTAPNVAIDLPTHLPTDRGQKAA
jgi:NAD(P)H-quinone oxidoreductase subunit 4